MKRRLRRAFSSGDSGAFVPMVAVMLVGLLAMVALAVDGAGRMRAQQHADDVAAEAARAGGQAINVSQAVKGTADVVSRPDAIAAAKAYLRSAGVNGRVSVSSDLKHITVTVTIKYQAQAYEPFGLGSGTETGTATAVLLTQ